jgi:hypothetical protein
MNNIANTGILLAGIGIILAALPDIYYIFVEFNNQSCWELLDKTSVQ